MIEQATKQEADGLSTTGTRPSGTTTGCIVDDEPERQAKLLNRLKTVFWHEHDRPFLSNVRGRQVYLVNAVHGGVPYQ